MYIMSLKEMYDYLVKEKKIYDFMQYNEKVNLHPVSDMEYSDKIRGAMVSLAIGDVSANDFEKPYYTKTDGSNSLSRVEKTSGRISNLYNTEIVMHFAESLISYQGFNPEGMANRFFRQLNYTSEDIIDKFLKECLYNPEIFKNGHESAGSMVMLRCAPGALINYGDYASLKLLAGMQAAITHTDQMVIASSVAYSTAVACLANLPPFSLDSDEDILEFLQTCSQSIKGIETIVRCITGRKKISHLYSRLSKDLPEAIDKKQPISALIEKWGRGRYALESLPLALYIFLKHCNDYDRILEECLQVKDANTVVMMALSLAGSYVGYNNIPQAHLNKVINLEEMISLADRLYETARKNKHNNPSRQTEKTIEDEKVQNGSDILLSLGIEHNKKSEFDKAVIFFENLLTQNPDLKENEKIKPHIIEAYEGLGVKCLGNEAFDDALKCFRKALAYDLNHPVILCDLAATYLNLDDLIKAEKYARRAVDIVPECEAGKEVLEIIKNFKNRK